MKSTRIFNLISSFVILSFVILSLPACVTTSDGGRTLDPDKAPRLAAALRVTVSGAVVYAHTKDPNSIAYIDVVKTFLQEFLLGQDLRPAVLQAKLYALPVKELKTPEAQLIITPILAAYKAIGEEYIRAGLAEKSAWQLLIQSLADGIDDGLQGIAQIAPKVES